MSVTALRGGLDLVTAPIEVRPGFALAAENYEPEARGYVRSRGYERLDGRPAPSEGRYWLINLQFATRALVPGEMIAGGVTGATGAVLDGGIVTSGSYASGDAAVTVVLSDVTGAFAPAETVAVAGAQVALAMGAAMIASANDIDDDARFEAMAADRRRADIGAPPGSGPIRGLATFRGEVLCWRDNAGGTAGAMHKATAGGWVTQTAGTTIGFDGGASEFAVGATITGVTSGATAKVQRVVLSEGAWSGEGRGYLVLSDVSGTFTIGETITGPGAQGSASVLSIQPVALPAGGRYVSVEHNFYASEGTARLYVANGVGPAFEWSGEVLAPILTGLSASLEKPSHVAVHQGHLALGYSSGSLQLSAIGRPLTFNALQGAIEIGFGNAITGLLSEARGSLVVTGRSKVGYLTGSSLADFALQIISQDSGALPYSLQAAGGPVYVDDRGLREMRTTEAFGDWRMGTVTQLVEPLMRSKRETALTLIGTMRVRSRDQVRLFWEDGSGLAVYMGRSQPEAMPLRLGFRPSCLASGENADGSEILLAGSDDGMVYRLDRGTSHDGAPIEAFVRLAFDNQGSPNWMKRYHRARIEGRSLGARSTIGIGAEFGYADSPPSEMDAVALYGAGGAWNEATTGRIVWSAAAEGQVMADLDGIGENVGLLIASTSAVEHEHVLSAATVYHSPRRMIR